MITIADIKIKIKLLNSKTILAQATVILFDVWEEHGWKVLRSNRIHPIFQEKIWIQAPSFQSKKNHDDWKEMVFINDRKLWEQVLEKIYDAYHMAQTREIDQKSVKKSNQRSTEDVDPDEIPL